MFCLSLRVSHAGGLSRYIYFGKCFQAYSISLPFSFSSPLNPHTCRQGWFPLSSRWVPLNLEFAELYHMKVTELIIHIAICKAIIYTCLYLYLLLSRKALSHSPLSKPDQVSCPDLPMINSYPAEEVQKAQDCRIVPCKASRPSSKIQRFFNRKCLN